MNGYQLVRCIDGEIVAIDKGGRTSFNLLQHYRSHAQALLFYAFDVIVCQGKSVMSAPLEKRRALLNDLFADLGKDASPLRLSETMDAPPDAPKPDLVITIKKGLTYEVRVED